MYWKTWNKSNILFHIEFANHAAGVINRLLTGGHELASHGIRHTEFAISDLKESRMRLSEIAGKPIIGYRMPRMMKLPEKAIAEAGYLYDSSLNPTFIPGRYMNLRTPRYPFMKDGVLQIPTSVTPWVRFPMFWLSAHLLPLLSIVPSRHAPCGTTAPSPPTSTHGNSTT